MSEQQFPGVPEDALTADAYATAGARLRAAREAHGLSIDTVAQHLKLAPRQVRALENGDYGELPGRTFIRGFARNYARLMHLDPDAIVAALPDAVAAPALDKPAIGISTRPMGELPVSQQARGITWSRWAIPLAIAALIGVAAMYEITRKESLPLSDKAPAAKRVQVDPIGPLTGAGTPLPNPLAGSETTATQAPANAPPMDAPTGPPRGDPAALPGPPASPPPSLPITVANAPTVPSSTSSVPAAATLVIKYRGASWTEVRDANGQRLLLVTGAPGTSETVSGTPPFELTLGNAAQTSVTWRGAAFDLGPHVKANVARARLP
jgi:cytoskeleton protein RodZ